MLVLVVVGGQQSSLTEGGGIASRRTLKGRRELKDSEIRCKENTNKKMRFAVFFFKKRHFYKSTETFHVCPHHKETVTCSKGNVARLSESQRLRKSQILNLNATKWPHLELTNTQGAHDLVGLPPPIPHALFRGC